MRDTQPDAEAEVRKPESIGHGGGSTGSRYFASFFGSALGASSLGASFFGASALWA